MGYLKSVGTSFVWICTFLAAITFIPGLPPNVTFSSYSIKPPAAIDKALNIKLNAAEKLFEGEIKGPEAFDVYDGVLYTGMHGGAVSKLIGDKLVEVVRFGRKCDGLWEEEKCGRPLGLKFDKHGNLYVVDTYYGIYKVNVKTGKYEKVVDTSLPIKGKVAMTPNSIDVADNGDLYWTDSSTEYKLNNGVYTILSDPTGRLIRYNAAKKTNEVLVENIGFANGVKLSDDESFVIVAATMTSSIIKYHLKGSKAGKSEIFIDALPGLPDNIHSDGQGNFLVSLIVHADEENPVLTQSLAAHPNIRKMILRFLYLIELPYKFIEEAYPNYYTKRIVHWFGHLESTSFMFSPSVTILRIDSAGKILNALESDDGHISDISSAFVMGDYLWLGSPYKEYMGKILLDKVLPELKVTKQSAPKVTHNPTRKAEEKPIPNRETTTQTTLKPTTAVPKPQIQKTQPPPAAQIPKEAKANVETVKKPIVQGGATKPVVTAKGTENVKPRKNTAETKPAKQAVRDEM